MDEELDLWCSSRLVPVLSIWKPAEKGGSRIERWQMKKPVSCPHISKFHHFTKSSSAAGSLIRGDSVRVSAIGDLNTFELARFLLVERMASLNSW
jgi:hypothetical protein